MLLYLSMALDSFDTPHSIALLAASRNTDSEENTFSCQSSYLRFPFQKPRAVLKVLVVSLSRRRANHSSERCGASVGWREDFDSGDKDVVMMRWKGGGWVGRGARVVKLLKKPNLCISFRGKGVGAFWGIVPNLAIHVLLIASLF